jgi:hypothetical protein
MDAAQIPQAWREAVVCSVAASAEYQIPSNLLLAVAEKEGGKVNWWVRNSNGSYDVGPMQFNTQYLRTLSAHGITERDVAAPGCYPYRLAAWRIARHLTLDGGDLWTRAANYHSRTPTLNSRYRSDLIGRAGRWADRLKKWFPVTEVTSGQWISKRYE